MRISRTWMWQCTCGEKTSSMASQAGFQRSCVYTYSKGEIMDTMTKLCLYTYMLITVNWSGVFHAILQILWQICLLTHHCVGRVANKKRTSHGEFGLGNLHIVKSPRLSRYKLQTLDNYPALEMIRCLEILKLLLGEGTFPWSQFAIYFCPFFWYVFFSFKHPARCFVSGSPDEDWSIETFEVGAWECVFFWVLEVQTYR